jgi:hypothetical protein
VPEAGPPGAICPAADAVGADGDAENEGLSDGCRPASPVTTPRKNAPVSAARTTTKSRTACLDVKETW